LAPWWRSQCLSPPIATPSKLTLHRRAHVFAPQQHPRSGPLLFGCGRASILSQATPPPRRHRHRSPGSILILMGCSRRLQGSLFVPRRLPGRTWTCLPGPLPKLLPLAAYLCLFPRFTSASASASSTRTVQGRRTNEGSILPRPILLRPIPDLDNSKVSKRPTRSLQARGRRAATLANPILFYLLQISARFMSNFCVCRFYIHTYILPEPNLPAYSLNRLNSLFVGRAFDVRVHSCVSLSLFISPFHCY